MDSPHISEIQSEGSELLDRSSAWTISLRASPMSFFCKEKWFRWTKTSGTSAPHPDAHDPQDCHARSPEMFLVQGSRLRQRGGSAGHLGSGAFPVRTQAMCNCWTVETCRARTASGNSLPELPGAKNSMPKIRLNVFTIKLESNFHMFFLHMYNVSMSEWICQMCAMFCSVFPPGAIEPVLMPAMAAMAAMQVATGWLTSGHWMVTVVFLSQSPEVCTTSRESWRKACDDAQSLSKFL